jgi:uncharacterized damage-inducible protein DinB
MPPTRNNLPLLARAIGAILERDLGTLQRELEAYPDERDLWREAPGIPNVGGTLALHLTGNIQHYFGHHLGKSSYVRDRPAEFARRRVSRSELLQEVEAARVAVRAAVDNLSDEQLERDYPEVISGSQVRTGEYLIHLATHFTYHLGQLDYHRRVVTGKSTGVGAVQPAELSSGRKVEPR